MGMIGQTIHLTSGYRRKLACEMVQKAPYKAIVNIKPQTRSNEQNALLWALLSDISRAKPEGRELTPDVWKSLFLHALDHAQRFEMALDGKGMVPVGFRSSRLSVGQMSDLIEFIREYAARHGVELEEV